MKTEGIKPNYAELARMHNCDYRAVKKYDDGYAGKPVNRDKESKLDKYKEDIKMFNKYGEIFEFNIFSSTLGASRFQIFVYSKFKTRNDVQRCLIKTFQYIGGITN